MILVTYGMRYITMEADCQAYVLAKERTSSTMWAETRKMLQLVLISFVFHPKLFYVFHGSGFFFGIWPLTRGPFSPNSDPILL